MNHQGTCERENLSFLSNLNENNRNTLLSSLSHFCKGEKEVRNLNTLKKIFTFPKEKWKILIEMIQFDQEYHGYDSKKEYNKEILEKYYTLSDTERMKILPYLNPELPTFLKEFKFLDRLLQTIDFEDGEIEDLKYLLKTDIFTLQKNKITKIPDYTKAI
ncbi:MAG: hypothetical protein K6E76_05280 [Patescibacteria group bacterium]|nr:hypothetical protein [Patescibacteria group bacterium]